ncbi:MAG: 7-cyano-7-deazaguanine synthase QueC [Candidatus Melainabacteria bacterium]|nr:7-cyano-7-deazaguanine synthase QueC [Candidatus Melainabacteria bacterium]
MSGLLRDARNDGSALVIFSGGQDSTTCLYWAKSKWSQVYTLTFDYGQKHDIELESARKICERAGLDFDLVKIPDVLRSTSPLVDLSQKLDQYESIDQFEDGVQPTFVPGRNILFLTIAANAAVHHGCSDIVLGVCEADFAGYYDCRQDFIDAMQVALNQGLFGQDQGLTLHTPLMSMTKSETVQLAADLGQDCLDALSYSHTCYDGGFPPCGKCHACLLRAKGFAEAGLEDPLVLRTPLSS